MMWDITNTFYYGVKKTNTLYGTKQTLSKIDSDTICNIVYFNFKKDPYGFKTYL